MFTARHLLVALFRHFAAWPCVACGGLTVAAALIGCNGYQTPTDSIIGKWTQSDAASIQTLEFTEQGTLILQLKGVPQPLDGKYKLIDDATIETDILTSIEAHLTSEGGKVLVPWWAATGKAMVSVSGNELTITDDKDNKDVFRRAE